MKSKIDTWYRRDIKDGTTGEIQEASINTRRYSLYMIKIKCCSMKIILKGITVCII